MSIVKHDVAVKFNCKVVMTTPQLAHKIQVNGGKSQCKFKTLL